jgi:YD repeat-containing protein
VFTRPSRRSRECEPVGRLRAKSKIAGALNGETPFTFLGARGAPPPLAAARLADRQTFVGFGTTGTPPTYVTTITTTYDAGDRATAIVDSGAGTIGRTYDLLDRLTQETTPEGTVSYTHDAADRRATMTVGAISVPARGKQLDQRLDVSTQSPQVLAIETLAQSGRKAVCH